MFSLLEQDRRVWRQPCTRHRKVFGHSCLIAMLPEAKLEQVRGLRITSDFQMASGAELAECEVFAESS